jgi:hypothetical protein
MTGHLFVIQIPDFPGKLLLLIQACLGQDINSPKWKLSFTELSFRDVQNLLKLKKTKSFSLSLNPLPPLKRLKNTDAWLHIYFQV